MSSEVRFTDFKSDKQPTWCPGCGDFGTMNGMMKALAETGNELKITAALNPETSSS